MKIIKKAEKKLAFRCGPKFAKKCTVTFAGN